MKNILLLSFAIALFSCKKEDKKPVETVLVQSFVKSGNGNLKVFESQIQVPVNYSNEFNVEDKSLSIRLVNNIKSLNDSINLKVTYNGVTKQQGMKLVNTTGNISFYLSDF